MSTQTEPIAADPPITLAAPSGARSAELIEPDSLTAELGGQWTYLPINGAAFLMQAMHPTIGDVVDRYSTYTTDPYGRGIRSFDSLLQWIYGGQSALAEGQRLRRLHRDLTMTNSDGQRISALNPDAYAWVIATAYPSTVWAAPYMLGRPLTDAEDQAVFDDIHRIARIVQVPEGVIPADRPAFWRYYHAMVENTLVNHPVAERIVTELLPHPPMPTYLPTSSNPRHLPAPVAAALRPVWRPISSAAGRYLYLSTVGPVGPEIRDILGITWTRKEQRQLEILYAGIRVASRSLPERVTYAPLAYHARRHHRALHQMKHRELISFADQPGTRSCPM